MDSNHKVEDFLEHYGVKGMKWGVRKGKIRTTRKINTKGYSKDAKVATAIRVKGKSNPAKVKSLTNQEIETFLKRVNLESRFVDMTPGPGKRALNVVKSLLGVGTTMNQAAKFAESPSGQAIRSGFEKGKKKKPEAPAA